jgi:GTPase SAR1 family protein
MSQDTFKEKIEQELKKLTRKQKINFAWRCAVYALPILGNHENFNFWDIKNRQKYIYSIFYALDISTFAATDVTFTAANSAAVAANSAAFAANAAAVAANSAAFAANAAAVAANSAAIATKAAKTTDVAFASAFIADVAAKAAAFATKATQTTDVADKKNINLKSIIVQDLTILQGEKGEHISTKLYGEIWHNFQKALEAEDCAYWGKLYQNIFDNNFVLDKKALKRRLSVPKEIREQGAAAVGNYLEKLEEKGIARLNEARIIILGDKGAGKTCIARRLIKSSAPMTKDTESTAGVDTTLWKLEKENINIRIWDFAGHTITHTVHQFFLSERCLYLIVYNSRTEERNRLEYWLDHMKNYGGDSKAIILVNKRDQHSVNIPINTLKEQYPIEKVYNFSIKDDKTELKAFRQAITRYIENNPSWKTQEIPANYYQVKEELEKKFIKGDKEKGKEHITKEEFETIAKDNDVDDTEKLLKDLHALGISLWYQNMKKFNTLILNPEWISHGVYKIINWVNEEKKYSLTLNDFKTVFNDNTNRYPKESYEFLFDLMKHYELAYQTKRGKELIIPHLLKEDRPKELPTFSVGESLMLRYKSELLLPPNTISKFIVRHNHQIKKEKNNYIVWRYGVVLEDTKGSLALVREEDRTISVSVKGQDKTNFLTTLRETLNDIFNKYKSDKPELQYRIEGFGKLPDDIEIKDSLWLSDRKIINHHKRSKPYYDDVTDQNILMSDIVNIYNIEAENAILGGRDHRIIKTTFNFHECNINLQGHLNELIRLLTDAGNKEEAKELKNVVAALEQTEKCKSKEEVKKKGLANMLKYLVQDLENENSKLYKTVKVIKHGISIAQDIIRSYNSIAQWLSLL